MRNSHIIFIIIIILAVAGLLLWLNPKTDNGSLIPKDDNDGYLSTTTVETPNVADLIQISSPKSGEMVQSPLRVTGQARGTWYFEASFPVILTNWDGLIIAETYAQAQSDWMTEDFVRFESTINFTKPECPTGADYCKRGYLILQKDNPSGLPQHDAAIEIPVMFE